MKDLYSILNVTKEASISDMKKSYKKLAFKYHPDKNKEEGSQEIFAELSDDLLSQKINSQFLYV